MKTLLKNSRGLSLIELVVTMVILSILASVIVPSAQMTAKRTKEIELRRNLRTIRTAIDNYRKDYDKSVAGGAITTADMKDAYPETLQQLVDGKDWGGLYPVKQKYLRRIPTDPFHPPKDPKDISNEKELWGLRSSVDKSDSTSWGGENVYDVYSLSEETAIDQTKYKDW